MPESRLQELNRTAREKAGREFINRETLSLVAEMQAYAVNAQQKKDGKHLKLSVLLDDLMVLSKKALNRIDEDIAFGR
jgi:hypothetical protein